MKIRSGFVSNSSSSSYVVVGTKAPPYTHVKLPTRLGKEVLGYLFRGESLKEGESVFLTSYMSDTDVHELFGHQWDWSDPELQEGYRLASDLMDGGHGGIYTHNDPDYVILKEATDFFPNWNKEENHIPRPMNAVYLHKKFFVRLLEHKYGKDMYQKVLEDET